MYRPHNASLHLTCCTPFKDLLAALVKLRIVQTLSLVMKHSLWEKYNYLNVLQLYPCSTPITLRSNSTVV